MKNNSNKEAVLSLLRGDKEGIKIYPCFIGFFSRIDFFAQKGESFCRFQQGFDKDLLRAFFMHFYKQFMIKSGHKVFFCFYIAAFCDS